MPATALTVDVMNRSGVIPTSQTSDEVNGNSIANFQGDILVRLENTGASTRTVTFTAERADNDGNTIDAQVSLNAGEVKYVGPFKDRARWGGSDHLMQVTYSAGTGSEISLEVFRYPYQATEAATK